ncbi:MAG: cytochrome P450 [Candidatus Promineifilaceae bacterium]
MTAFNPAVAQARKGLPDPPGPNGHWLFGTTREFKANSLAFLQQLASDHGPAVRFRFFLKYVGYVFCHPEHNKHILQDNNHNYTKLPHPTFLLLEPLLGNGLLLNDGDSWLSQRRLMQPVFHRRQIADFGRVMSEATLRLLEAWEQAAAAGQAVDIDRAMMRLTLEIVGRTLFSMDLTGDAERLGQTFTDINHQFAKMTTQPFSVYMLRMAFLPSIRRLHHNLGQLNEVVERIIAERRGHGRPAAGNDLLAMLMAACDADTGERMTDQQLRDEVMTLLLAGHETTSNALTWTLFLLSEHPDCLAQAQQELTEVLAGRPPAFADLPDLPYTRQVLDEALRLYPPAYAIARHAAGADEVGGYRVPALAAVTLSPYLTHRLPEFWPEPERFDPGRFRPEQVAERPRYAYIPFGGGPRQCIGKEFALTEAHLILATILQRFAPRLAPGHPVEVEPLITLRPRFGLPMFLQPA